MGGKAVSRSSKDFCSNSGSQHPDRRQPPIDFVRSRPSLWTVKNVSMSDGTQVYSTFKLRNLNNEKLAIRFLCSDGAEGRLWQELLTLFMLGLGIRDFTSHDSALGRSIWLRTDSKLLQCRITIAKAMGYRSGREESLTRIF